MSDTIRSARLEAGLTQQEMSDLLQIPKRTIENWEGGQRRPAKWAETLIIEKLKSLKK